MHTLSTGLALLSLLAWAGPGASAAAGAEVAPDIAALSVPVGGAMQLYFHGGTGPFRVQKRQSMESPWVDIPEAKVTAVNTGVYLALLPMGPDDYAFYRVVSEAETIVELKGWTVRLEVSAPTNGLYFTPGEQPVVTVRLLDNFAQDLGPSDFASLNLYMYGPQEPEKVVTAVKLLNASTNRAARPHHYIDLKTSPGVEMANNVFTYRLQPVTDEAPGTYRIALNAVRGSDAMQQVMRFTDVQIGTANVERSVVSNTKCASCHQGAISGKMYMHHVDPGRSPVGSWALDLEPVSSCKACHNNDGYAAYTDTNAPGGRVSDAWVLRVHGVHMGEELRNTFNTNSVNGNFRDYTHVVFPADIRKCTTCHIDERWKTHPTRQACGACHDNTWFGEVADKPPTMTAHRGGPRFTDKSCGVCHPPEGPSTDEFTFSVEESHAVARHPTNAVEIALSRPANGTHYVAGETPVASIVIKNDAGESIGDHTKVTAANFASANFYVYGPRSMSVPVLTSKARAGADVYRPSVTCSVNPPWNIDGKVFTVAINGSAPVNITIVGTPGAVTAAQVVSSLNPVITNLNGGAIASVSSGRVRIQTLIRGSNARIAIYDGEVTTVMGWKAKGVTLDPDVTVAAGSTVGNDLRPVTNPNPLDWIETNVVRTTTNILYQLGDVAGLAPGTYVAFAYYTPAANNTLGITNSAGLGVTTFQIGTATAEKRIAVNCTACHGETIFHLYEAHVHPAQFDPDQCKACHDYGHEAGGEMFKNQGGTSLNGWSGFGAMPISRRVHGVHRGNYLEHPEQIYANATVDTFGHIIYPQDIRNCTSCHAESDTWKQKPSRIACLACHDEDAAKVHGMLMTYMPDPNDPYGPKAMESCEVCHGAGKAYSPDKVHSIADPYVPPYPRAPREP